MAIYSIYRFTNLVNGKVYIGQTRNLAQRFAGHIRASKSESQTLLHRAIRKYGIDNFSFQVLFHVFDEADLSSYEQAFIAEHDCCALDGDHKGYNMTRGGEGIGSELCAKLQQERVKQGKHNWLGINSTNDRSQHNQKMLSNGRHPFAGKAGSKLATARNLKAGNTFAGSAGSAMHAKLLIEGKHQSQQEHVCPHCGKAGKGAGMYNWHFDRCRKKITK